MSFLALNLLSPDRLLLADKVKAISSEGDLTLDDGRQIHLAGLVMTAEGIGMARLLIASKEIEYQLDKQLSKSAGTSQAYLFVDTREIEFPFELKKVPRESRVMVNEILLAMGAAQVNDTFDFEHKGRFKEIEETARKKGEGLWSYERFSGSSQV